MSDSHLDALADFGDFLEGALRKLGPRCNERGQRGSFSLLEHLWHLADLEREGFCVRVERLRTDEDPVLPDFDGDRIARERDYQSRDAIEGLQAFRAARERNLGALRALESDDWVRAGYLARYGPLTLRDLPRLMQEHDASHRAEIEELLSNDFWGRSTEEARVPRGGSGLRGQSGNTFRRQKRNETA